MNRKNYTESVKRIAAVFCVLLISSSAWATQYINSSAASKACDSSINDERVDGFMYDTETYPRVLATTTVKCSPLAAPSGTRYLEWNVPQVLYGQDPHGIGPDIYPVSTVNLVAGRTYYLASFWRFQRINGNDIWHDQNTNDPPYSFDKLIEINGSGFRWGVGVGWNGEYQIGTDHKFSIDAWYAQSILGDHGLDHIVADQGGYGRNNPPLMDYERWYGIVLGITAQNNDNGRVQLWLDGVKLIDQAHYTMNNGGQIYKMNLDGTISQPGYDAPPHLRQAAALLVTDNWQDIVDGGYLMSSPTPPPGGQPLDAPIGLHEVIPSN